MRRLGSLTLALACATIALGVGGCSDRSDGLTTTQSEVVVASEAAPTTTTTLPPLTPDSWLNLYPSVRVPRARYGHSAVYDPGTEKMIVFGGANYTITGWEDGPFFQDLWAYDFTSNTWTELEQTGETPPGRIYASMVYDPESGRSILFGGEDHDGPMDDLWSYDPGGSVWARLQPEGAVPLARSGHTMVYDPVGRQMILFGGGLEEDLSRNTWSYDPSANAWTELSPRGALPAARIGHSMVYDALSERILLFGGTARVKQVDRENDPTGYVDDLWAYYPGSNRWVELRSRGDVPLPREHCGLVYEPAGAQLVLFGGRGHRYLELGDTKLCDVQTRTWTWGDSRRSSPMGRHSMSMVYESVAGVLIVFGGYNDITELNDTWVYVPADYAAAGD